MCSCSFNLPDFYSSIPGGPLLSWRSGGSPEDPLALAQDLVLEALPPLTRLAISVTVLSPPRTPLQVASTCSCSSPAYFQHPWLLFVDPRLVIASRISGWSSLKTHFLMSTTSWHLLTWSSPKVLVHLSETCSCCLSTPLLSSHLGCSPPVTPLEPP